MSNMRSKPEALGAQGSDCTSSVLLIEMFEPSLDRVHRTLSLFVPEGTADRRPKAVAWSSSSGERSSAPSRGLTWPSPPADWSGSIAGGPISMRLSRNTPGEVLRLVNPTGVPLALQWTRAAPPQTWCPVPGLNRRPADYESDALTI